MDEQLLIEAVERYLNHEMTPQECAFFEDVRKNNAEVDQMVVEHSFFLHSMSKYADQKNFRHLLNEIDAKLTDEGVTIIPKPTGKALVISLWGKYKRNIAVAASIAGFISLVTSGLMINFNKHYGNDQITELVKQINHTNKELEKVKKQGKNSNTNSTAVKIEPQVDYRATGFLIDGKGYLVTNAHVTSKLKNIYVQNSKGEYFESQVVLSDPNTDLAILKIVDTSFRAINNLPYSIKKSNADLGDQFFTLGFPRNEIVYGEGYVSAKSGNDGDSTAYQLTVSANPGNSGGPVINRSGEIIGIITGKDSKADGVVFAAKAKNIFKLVDQLKKDDHKNQNFKLAANNDLRRLDRNQQIKKMEEFVFMVVGN